MARYTHTIDAKGRVFIPARLRDELGKILVVTQNIDDGYLVQTRLHAVSDARSSAKRWPVSLTHKGVYQSAWNFGRILGSLLAMKFALSIYMTKSRSVPRHSMMHRRRTRARCHA
jgi:bifunctional DNA-binding transcriptional regulator/antitoxin component of YhaV-PrlF toxin-antitoxin module